MCTPSQVSQLLYLSRHSAQGIAALSALIQATLAGLAVPTKHVVVCLVHKADSLQALFIVCDAAQNAFVHACNASCTETFKGGKRAFSATSPTVTKGCRLSAKCMRHTTPCLIGQGCWC
jgi:hypothetical protein